MTKESQPADMLRSFDNRRPETPVHESLRPLGSFSDFICKDLGDRNLQLTTFRSQSNPVLSQARKKSFTDIERLTAEVPEEVFQELEKKEQVTNRRVALIDLLFAIRSLDVAYQDDTDYQKKLSTSHVYQRAKKLAQIEGRPPMLSWSDTAIYHPMEDPRSFLAPGPEREQEIALYRTNGGVDAVFKSIIQKNYNHTTPAEIELATEGLQTVVRAMSQLNRGREVGHFDRLTPFSAFKDDKGKIVSSGAFSAWTHLIGWFLTENETFKQRLLDPDNRKYFDSDAHQYIDLLQQGNFKTLHDHITQNGSNELANTAEQMKKIFLGFLSSHRNAVKKHALSQFHEPSPSNPALTNDESINQTLKK